MIAHRTQDIMSFIRLARITYKQKPQSRNSLKVAAIYLAGILVELGFGIWDMYAYLAYNTPVSDTPSGSALTMTLRVVMTVYLAFVFNRYIRKFKAYMTAKDTWTVSDEINW